MLPVKLISATEVHWLLKKKINVMFIRSFICMVNKDHIFIQTKLCKNYLKVQIRLTSDEPLEDDFYNLMCNIFYLNRVFFFQSYLFTDKF